MKALNPQLGTVVASKHRATTLRAWCGLLGLPGQACGSEGTGGRRSRGTGRTYRANPAAACCRTARCIGARRKEGWHGKAAQCEGPHEARCRITAGIPRGWCGTGRNPPQRPPTAIRKSLRSSAPATATALGTVRPASIFPSFGTEAGFDQKLISLNDRSDRASSLDRSAFKVQTLRGQ